MKGGLERGAVSGKGPEREIVHSGSGYISQPSTTAVATNPPNIIAAVPNLLARIVPHQRRKHDGHEEREEGQQQEVTGHLRPIAISKASRITRKFKSPATIRKVLPYS